jgi:hypothetical protein
MALFCRAFKMSPRDYRSLSLVEFKALLETLDLEDLGEV